MTLCFASHKFFPIATFYQKKILINQEEQAAKSESNEGCRLLLELKGIWYVTIARN